MTDEIRGVRRPSWYADAGEFAREASTVAAAQQEVDNDAAARVSTSSAGGLVLAGKVSRCFFREANALLSTINENDAALAQACKAVQRQIRAAQRAEDAAQQTKSLHAERADIMAQRRELAGARTKMRTLLVHAREQIAALRADPLLNFEDAAAAAEKVAKAISGAGASSVLTNTLDEFAARALLQ